MRFMYSGRDIAVLAFSAGLLTGMVLAFSSCEPSDTAQHVTTTGRR